MFKTLILTISIVLIAAPSMLAAGLFVSAPLVPAGQQPFGVVLSDFNGDGKLDFAVANQIFAGTVSVSLENGRGQFQPAAAFSTDAFYTVALTAGDLNGDGHADIAALNNCNSARCTNGTLTILLGNGDGTFQNAVNYDLGITPKAVVIADLNGDGKPDMAATSSSSNFVSVFVNQGGGTFAAGVTYSVGANTLPAGLAVADLNADGVPDLVTADSGKNAVSTRLGNGDGTFQAPHSVALTEPAYAVLTGDFNKDGVADVVVATAPILPGAGAVSLLLGKGDGTFRDGGSRLSGCKSSSAGCGGSGW